jgi:hypothetical protein
MVEPILRGLALVAKQEPKVAKVPVTAAAQGFLALTSLLKVAQGTGLTPIKMAARRYHGSLRVPVSMRRDRSK